MPAAEKAASEQAEEPSGFLNRLKALFE
jgi:hypothetical protein